MGKEVILTPKELYYLGTLMRAEYIDYDYIAILDDIESNYKGFESECEASLTQKGILLESFTGKVEIEKDVEPILKPVFFGKAESSINDMDRERGGIVSVTKFHFFQDTITMVKEKDNALVLTHATLENLKKCVADLLELTYNPTGKIERADVQEDEASRIISFKHINIDTEASVNIVTEVSGVFYAKDQSGKVVSLTKQEFEQFGYEWIRGRV